MAVAERRELNDTEAAIILELLRSEAMTRNAVSRLLNRSRATVFRACDNLVSRGWLDESGSSGRAGLIRIGARALSVLSVVLVADRLHVSVVGADLGLQGQVSEPVNLRYQGPDEILDRLVPLAVSVARTAGLELHDLDGAGMAIASRIEFGSGRPATPPYMPLWHGHPLQAELSERLGISVVVDNDANLIALGEWYRGAARNSNDFVYMFLNDGVGAGIVAGGRLLRGWRGFAGELGHTSVCGSLMPCLCGKRGCLDVIASAGAVLGRFEGRDHEDAAYERWRKSGPHSLAPMIAALERRDPRALETIEVVGRAVGEVLASAVNLLNPEVIVLGGVVTGLGEPLRMAIRRGVVTQSLAGSALDLRIEMGSPWIEAATHGAGALAIEMLVGRAKVGRAG